MQAGCIDGTRQDGGQICTDEVLNIQAGLVHELACVIGPRSNGLGLHQDLTNGLLGFGGGIALGHPVGRAGCRLLREGHIADQVSDRGRANRLQDHAVAEHLDHAHLLGGFEVAACSECANIEIALLTQDIDRDKESLGLLARAGGYSFAGFRLEGGDGFPGIGASLAEFDHCPDAAHDGIALEILLAQADLAALLAQLGQGLALQRFEALGAADDLIEIVDLFDLGIVGSAGLCLVELRQKAFSIFDERSALVE